MNKFLFLTTFLGSLFAHFFPQRLRVRADIKASDLVLNFIIFSSQHWANPRPLSSVQSLKYRCFGACGDIFFRKGPRPDPLLSDTMRINSDTIE
jgi:hypothetical protein